LERTKEGQPPEDIGEEEEEETPHDTYDYHDTFIDEESCSIISPSTMNFMELVRMAGIDEEDPWVRKLFVKGLIPKVRYQVMNKEAESIAEIVIQARKPRRQ